MSVVINHDISLMVYHLRTPKIDLKKFAQSVWNCVIRSKTPFRCTYYGSNFTMNMFTHSDIIFCKVPIENFLSEVADVLNMDTSLFSYKLKNIVCKFRTNMEYLNLNDLFERNLQQTQFRNGRHINFRMRDDIWKNDFQPQRFPALIVGPFTDKKRIVLEIFASGVINCTGLINMSEIQRVHNFLSALI